MKCLTLSSIFLCKQRKLGNLLIFMPVDYTHTELKKKTKTKMFLLHKHQIIVTRSCPTPATSCSLFFKALSL